MNQKEPSGKITFSGIANPEGSELPCMFDIFTIDANGQNVQQLTFGESGYVIQHLVLMARRSLLLSVLKAKMTLMGT